MILLQVNEVILLHKLMYNSYTSSSTQDQYFFDSYIFEFVRHYVLVIPCSIHSIFANGHSMEPTYHSILSHSGT